MFRNIWPLGAAAALAACSVEASAEKEAEFTGPPHTVAETQLAAGKYLAIVGGCHDCHTAGWPESGGHIARENQLLGVPVGFRGPWGTSYPNNLRLVAAAYTPEEWVEMMRTRQGLPPMPWSTVNAMSDEDLLAIHAYLVSLGEAGEAMPPAVPPDSEPQTPFIYFVPVGPARDGAPITLP